MVGERISAGFFGTSEKNMECGEEIPKEDTSCCAFLLNSLGRGSFLDVGEEDNGIVSDLAGKSAAHAVSISASLSIAT